VSFFLHLELKRLFKKPNPDLSRSESKGGTFPSHAGVLVARDVDSNNGVGVDAARNLQKILEISTNKPTINSLKLIESLKRSKKHATNIIIFY
jgi:hypothetical protein